MCTVGRGVAPLKAALDHLRHALTHLDAAEQHAAAAQVDHIIHDVQATISAASGT
jgi:hypothetical protein